MCGSTCFGCQHAHHQELIKALIASGFTVGALVVAALLVVVWPVITGYNLITGYNRATSRPTALIPTVKPEAANAVVSS